MELLKEFKQRGEYEAFARPNSEAACEGIELMLREFRKLRTRGQLKMAGPVRQFPNDLDISHVSDLLDAAKLESGRMGVEHARVDLSGLTRAMSSQFESLAHGQGIDYQLDVPSTLAAELDGEKVQRILLNLLSNAFKFTPAGGRIVVRLREEADQAVIEVEDNGPGVPTELHAVVFERFRQVAGGAQRRFGGTGLGLAIVKGPTRKFAASIPIWSGASPNEPPN